MLDVGCWMLDVGCSGLGSGVNDYKQAKFSYAVTECNNPEGIKNGTCAP